MIARIEALNYRCLRYVAQELSPFLVLVGPNGSGKSTFLDVVMLLGDFLANGLDDAILTGAASGWKTGRARRVEELFFQGQGDRFEVAVELLIPDRLRGASTNGAYNRARYELSLGRLEPTGELAILAETFWLILSTGTRPNPGCEPTLFTDEPYPPDTLLVAPGRKKSPRGWRKVVNKVTDAGNDYFQAETGKWNNLFKIGPRRSALANVPEDRERFPVALWARDFLRDGVQKIALNVAAMRRSCSPSLPTTFAPDGSNLPRVVAELRAHHGDRHQEWIADLREVLKDIRDVEVVSLPEDNHLYLRVHYEQGEPVPSWLLSDGTLRMLVLTLIPYLPVTENAYLIEEPENGVHPMAAEAVFGAISSVYDNQVLLATHSPLLLGKATLDQLLCFRRAPSGAAAVVSGREHPQLEDWKGEVDLATLYAAGVLS